MARLSARVVAFGLLAFTLIGAARLLEVHVAAELTWATVGLVTALVVLESALVVIVTAMFRRVH